MFTLIRVPASTITLENLLSTALSSVLNALKVGGYVVDLENFLEEEGSAGVLRKYAIAGPCEGSLLAAANASDDGDVVFRLDGERFGRQWGDRDTDTEPWGRLEGLATKYQQEFGVVATVDDPDFVTGGPGDPGTFIPRPRVGITESIAR